MAGTRKVTATIPDDLVVMLDEVAIGMGMARSALLTMLLKESLPPLRQLVELANNSSPDSRRRFRGDSIALLEQTIANAREKVGRDG